MDHNVLSIITTVVLTVLGLVIGVVGFMWRGWFNHVNTQFVETRAEIAAVGDDVKGLQKDREKRWREQELKCLNHAERLTWVEAKVNGRVKS